MLTWKTQIWEKITAALRLQTITISEVTEMGHRGSDLLLLRFATRRLQQRQQPLPLSLFVYSYAVVKI